MNKKNIYPVVLSVVAILIAIFAINRGPNTLEPQQDKATFDQVLEDDQLTACYVVWPPSVVKDPDTGELSGLIIEAMDNIAQDAELEIEYVESSWGGFAADLNAGKCDAGIAGFYPMINRSTAVSFTKPFYYAGNSAVVKKDDNRFQAIDELNQEGLKLAVLQGEYAHIYAEKYLPQAELVVLEKTADNTAPLLAVAAGQADVGFSMDDVIKEYVEEHPEVKELFTEPYSTTPITWAVRKQDQQLLNFLNNALDYLEATGELEALAKKYESTWLMANKEYQDLGQ